MKDIAFTFTSAFQINVHMVYSTNLEDLLIPNLLNCLSMMCVNCLSSSVENTWA